MGFGMTDRIHRAKMNDVSTCRYRVEACIGGNDEEFLSGRRSYLEGGQGINHDDTYQFT